MGSSPVLAGCSRSRRSAAHSLFLLLALVALTTAGKASAASERTFTVTNLCPFTVWPAAIPEGGGTQLEPGQTWQFKAFAGIDGATDGRVWGRTGCSFDARGRGWGASGDCVGSLHCQVAGKAPTTLAEFTIGDIVDYYDLSVADGFNLPMDFWCDSEPHSIQCRDPGCPDGHNKVRELCVGDSDYHVVFCAKEGRRT